MKAISPSDTHIPALRHLWKTAFADTDEFLDNFFSAAFSPSRCRIVAVLDTPVSALYWFDCSCGGKRIAYIYAVATDIAHRGKGFCHGLMADTHRQLQALGYEGALLVPSDEKLFDLYGGMGYLPCGGINEFVCEGGKTPDNFSLREMTADEYAHLRRAYLPAGGVVQEGENLRFLQTFAGFYSGNGFVLAARKEKEKLYVPELLGDISAAENIVAAFGCKKGIFRTAGKQKPFAMYLPFGNAPAPCYFGLAFD